jgi:hypothetical protein
MTSTVALSANAAESAWSFRAGHLALDFANTMDWHASDHPEELLNSYTDLVNWASDFSLLTPEEARSLSAEAERRPEAAAKTLKAAIALRESLYRIFSSMRGSRGSRTWRSSKRYGVGPSPRRRSYPMKRASHGPGPGDRLTSSGCSGRSREQQWTYCFLKPCRRWGNAPTTAAAACCSSIPAATTAASGAGWIPAATAPKPSGTTTAG